MNTPVFRPGGWRPYPHLRAAPCRVRVAPPKSYREIFQLLREIIPQP
ncbi:hypothetical protein [Ferrigenium sp. UT5]